MSIDRTIPTAEEARRRQADALEKARAEFPHRLTRELLDSMETNPLATSHSVYCRKYEAEHFQAEIAAFVGLLCAMGYEARWMEPKESPGRDQYIEVRLCGTGRSKP